MPHGGLTGQGVGSKSTPRTPTLGPAPLPGSAEPRPARSPWASSYDLGIVLTKTDGQPQLGPGIIEGPHCRNPQPTSGTGGVAATAGGQVVQEQPMIAFPLPRADGLGTPFSD